jgi:hypothetical protein
VSRCHHPAGCLGDGEVCFTGSANNCCSGRRNCRPTLAGVSRCYAVPEGECIADGQAGIAPALARMAEEAGLGPHVHLLGPREDMPRVLAALGDRVAAGQTLGFVEAMKMHTEITADQDGEIVEILAADQQPVQFGAPLFLLKPGGD